jgi:predicted ATPase
MINSITFPKLKTAYRATDGNRRNSNWGAFGYIVNTPGIFGKTFKFRPGLNILIGNNGAGKSTILRAMGMTLAAIQGGVSTVTERYVQDTFNFTENIMYPWTVMHDGQPILFVDPRETTGLASGGSAFDKDFLTQGISAVINRASTGEIAHARINLALSVIVGEEKMPAKIDWRLKKNDLNSTWKKRLELIDEMLTGTIPKGPQTIIMDEPESYLGLPSQVSFWKRIIAEEADRFSNLQVIIASHSPFAFGIKHANYVEIKKGYISECENALKFAGMM